MEIYQFQAVLEQKCHITTAQTVLAGVSGGADSLCLLDHLRKSGLHVVVAHFNHQLRPDADVDEAFVAQMAAKFNLPFISEKGDVRSHAAEKHISLEESGRTLRYQFLIRQAKLCDSNAIAVGHTADDQVETALMHLLRGSGIDGLRGMAWESPLSEWDSSIRLIRPLLGMWRKDTEDYCSAQGLNYLNDASNQNLVFYRNRIRRELIPFLETYNPGVKDVVLRMTQIMAGDWTALNQYSDQLWESCCIDADQGYAFLDRGKLLELPEGSQRLILRRAIQEILPSLRDIGYELIESARSYLMSPGETHQKSLAKDIWLFIEGNQIILKTHQAVMPIADLPQVLYPIELDIRHNGDVEIHNGWVLHWEMTHQPPREYESGGLSVWLDADQIEPPLKLTCRMEGDRFSPLGMNGETITVSDAFTNRKLPKQARSAWPILRDNRKILWIAGYQPCDQAKITPGSRNILHVVLQKKIH